MPISQRNFDISQASDKVQSRRRERTKTIATKVIFNINLRCLLVYLCSNMCGWHLNRLVSQVWVKDLLINPCVFICVPYVIAGIYWTSAIKTASAKSTGCQSNRNILNSLSNTSQLLSEKIKFIDPQQTQTLWHLKNKQSAFDVWVSATVNMWCWCVWIPAT